MPRCRYGDGMTKRTAMATASAATRIATTPAANPHGIRNRRRCPRANAGPSAPSRKVTNSFTSLPYIWVPGDYNGFRAYPPREPIERGAPSPRIEDPDGEEEPRAAAAGQVRSRRWRDQRSVAPERGQPGLWPWRSGSCCRRGDG